MEKGKLRQTFKAKCMLGMKRGGGRIHVLPHENKGNKGPCLSNCLLDSAYFPKETGIRLLASLFSNWKQDPMDPFATEGIRSPLPSRRLTRRVRWPLPLPRERQVGKGRRRREREDCTLHRPLPVLWVGTWGCRAWGLRYTEIAWVLLSVTVVMTSLTWVYDVNNHQASQCWLLTPALLGSEVASPWPWAGRMRAHRGDWSHWQLSELHRFLPVLLCKGCFHSWEPPAEKIGALNTYWRSSL